MECEKCREKATVHVSRIVNGSVVERHLCEKCAKEIYGLSFNGKISINNTLKGIIELMKEDGSENLKGVDLTCGKCGLSYREFKESGRLGCEECYRCFGERIRPIIKKMQRSDYHIGKVPKKSEAAFSMERSIDRYRMKMDEAVRIEDFEKAAKFRDVIKELEGKCGRNEGKDE